MQISHLASKLKKGFLWFCLISNENKNHWDTQYCLVFWSQKSCRPFVFSVPSLRINHLRLLPLLLFSHLSDLSWSVTSGEASSSCPFCSSLYILFLDFLCDIYSDPSYLNTFFYTFVFVVFLLSIFLHQYVRSMRIRLLPVFFINLSPVFRTQSSWYIAGIQ